ncbi:MAG: hypothetical protein ACRD4F_09495, partial [Candidatus Angelobacter sp.]
MARKQFSSIPTAAVVMAVLAIAGFILTRHSQLFSQTRVAAAQQSAGTAPPGPAATTDSVQQQLPPGTISYTAKAVTTAQF